MEQHTTYITQENNGKTFFLRFFANVLALGAANYLIDSVVIDTFFYLLLSAFIFTILNATLKPLFILLTLPITIITLGLFYPFINVIIINLLDLLMGKHFEITSIWDALLTSIIVAIVNFAVTSLFNKKEPQEVIIVHQE